MKTRVFGLLAAIMFCAAGALAVTESTVINFNNFDGAYPTSGLIFDSAGNAYGTTKGGLGTVYQLVPTRIGVQVNALYQFSGGADGRNPLAAPVMDSAGNLYGTASQGGEVNSNCQPAGCGTVWELSPVNGTWVFQVIYTFTGASDGGGPNYGSLVFDKAGNLYGVAMNGGNGYGTVFELSPSSDGWSESTLYNFHGATEGKPYSGLTIDGAGDLYGTTPQVVYELANSGSGWTESTIGSLLNSHLGESYGALLLRNGVFYGASVDGGHYSEGAVYSLTPSSKGYTLSVIYSFMSKKDGDGPEGGLVADGAGNLYGTTTAGGVDLNGTAFQLALKGGVWQKTVIGNFNITNGSDPVATPSIHGNALYGTTSGGGAENLGVVWKVTAK